CNVAPSSVTLDGTRSSTAQLVVTTTKNSALPDWPQSRIEQKLNPWSGVALLLLWIFLWFGWSKLLGVRRASLRALWPAVASMLTLTSSVFTSDFCPARRLTSVSNVRYPGRATLMRCFPGLTSKE